MIILKMAGQYCFQNNEPNGLKHPQIGVVVVPFPMQGHLNEILHLSCIITSYEIPVHFAGSITHNHQAKLRIHGSNPKGLSKIYFHDLQLPPFKLLPPDPGARIKFPGHLQPLFDTCSHLRHPVFQLLQQLSTKYRRIIVIHDSLMASVVQDVKFIPNAESFVLHSVSAFTIFFHTWESMTEKPFELDFNHIPLQIPTSEGCFTAEFANFVANEHKVLNFESGRLFNTCRQIEGKYMELLAKLPRNCNKKLFAIGPFNPVEFRTDSCLEWLDKQEKDSVIYVSFGSTTTMSDDQIRELALGLERSGQKFIWVVRNADKGDVFAGDEGRKPKLPEGYEDRVRNRGLVVRGWAPQIGILAHPSTGGFVSHCGWNSCMESISMGVPIAAWPMHSDQPKNAVLITQVLRIGICVRDWVGHAEFVRSNMIENVVRRLMASKEGEGFRKRAVEVGSMVRGSVAKGGASRLEMDSFIAYITRK